MHSRSSHTKGVKEISALELNEVLADQMRNTTGNLNAHCALFAAAAEKQFLEKTNQALSGWSGPAAHLRDALRRDELQFYCQQNLTLRTHQSEIAEVLVRLRDCVILAHTDQEVL